MWRKQVCCHNDKEGKLMTMSVAANHAKGKVAQDNIFGANAAANAAVAKVGKDKVVNATIGAYMNDDEKLACIPVVEDVYRSIPTNEFVGYAPIAGLPAYLDTVIDLTFGNCKPNSYIEAVATSGGSGAIHHAIWNYTEENDTVLTADWYWGPYKVFCRDLLRKFDTFRLFDEEMNFDIMSFMGKTKQILTKQNNLLVILNTPAHNPTGYSLTDCDWDHVMWVLREAAKDSSKKIILMVDIAYLDYAGDMARDFMKKFENLPDNFLVLMGFSMSKGYTMYGQRTGAIIGISSNKDVIQEFVDINQYSSRATWSNINRSAQYTLQAINNDPELKARLNSERDSFYQSIRGRADVFMKEAAECGLTMLPYRAGFFLTIPAKNTEAVCERLHDDYIFAVPLASGIRIAICAIPQKKVYGMAAKITQAIDELGK